MKYIFGVIGAIAGGILLEFEGVVIGFALGFLFGMIGALKRQVSCLQDRIHDLSGSEESPEKTPKTSTPTSEPSSSLQPSTYTVHTPESESAPQKPPPAIFSKADRSEETPEALVFENGDDELAETADANGAFQDRQSDFVNRLKAILIGDNLMVRVGLIVLFCGVAFLLKFAADRNMLPIEIRLCGAALGGLVMLAAGWRLRDKRRGYALAIQGGGVGVLYFTLFAAAKMHPLLPVVLALALMVAMVVLAGVLAVLQEAQVLAQFASAGGFLAPVLMSTGGGDHVMLFSYYTLLNAGIFGVAWFRSWRTLNLIGFVFTFGIGAAWGYQYYQPSYFVSTEPFLILFFVFYAVIAVLFAHRQAPNLKGYVDGALVFGLPLAFFGLQQGVVRDFTYGLAYSALGAAAFYILLAKVLWQKRAHGLRLLTEAYLSLGVVFGSLAIPLALEGRWTAALWSLEGFALIWVGVRQSRCLARNFGLLLQLGAGVAFLSNAYKIDPQLPVVNSIFLGCGIISLAGLSAARYLEIHADHLRPWEQPFFIPIFIWGVLWWMGGGMNEIDEFLMRKDEIHAYLLFFALSTLAMGLLARKLQWRAMRWPPLILFPAMLLTAWECHVRNAIEHPFTRWGAIPWTAAFAIWYNLMRSLEQFWWKRLVEILHQAALWLLVLILTWEAAWAVDWIIKDAEVWAFIVWSLVPGVVVLGLIKWGRAVRWPVRAYVQWYIGLGAGGLVLFMAARSVLSTFVSGEPRPLPYLPVLNPLEMGQLFTFLVMGAWIQHVRKTSPPWISALPVRLLVYALVILIFIWLNAAVARGVHFWGDTPFTWRAMFSSILFQAAISVVWSLTAFGVMGFATRRGLREVWFAGATLLGLEVLKLFVVDLSGIGTISRIVSFLAAGVLILIIGYFSPLPPKPKQHV